MAQQVQNSHAVETYSKEVGDSIREENPALRDLKGIIESFDPQRFSASTVPDCTIVATYLVAGGIVGVTLAKPELGYDEENGIQDHGPPTLFAKLLYDHSQASESLLHLKDRIDYFFKDGKHSSTSPTEPVDLHFNPGSYLF